LPDGAGKITTTDVPWVIGTATAGTAEKIVVRAKSAATMRVLVWILMVSS